jgi:CheY-like chemotaxis protein/PAS domain-containing protein
MAQFDSLLEALDDPVFELDLTGRVVYATPALALWTGRAFAASGTAPSYSFADILTSDESSRFQKAFKRIAVSKTDHAVLDMRLTRVEVEGEGERDSESVPVEVKLIGIAGPSGKTARIVGRIRDMSVEIAHEAAVNLQHTHLLGLVENITDACVIEDADGMIEMVNAAFCNLFDVKAAPQSLIGTECSALFEATGKSNKDQPLLTYPALDDVEARTNSFSLADVNVTHKILPVENDNGAEGRRVVGHRIAGRLHVFSAEAIASNTPTIATNSNATAVVSEALQMELIEKITRNLAIAVEGAGSAIHRAEQLELPGQVLEHFRRVESAARSAFAATAGLTDFTKLETNEITLSSSEFHLRESVAWLLEFFMPTFEERGIRIKLRIEQDVPEHLVGDGARLMLSIRNLIECELAHTEREAKISLTIEPEYAADNTVHLSFTVEHSQPKGASANMARHKTLGATGLMQLSLARQISRAFSRSLSTQPDGAGLGKIVIRERKDSISYQFAAPFAFRDVVPPRTRPTFFTLSGMPVLIVSADTTERKQLAELVRGWRMHPREADNASMALHLLERLVDEEQAVPLIITSNNLPIQDGFALAFRIKHFPKLKDATIVMLARDGKAGDAMACRENGISAYLRHPIRPDQLNDAIAAVMGVADDAEATQTLVTRHSLREAKVGTVLVIDGNREQGKLAAQILKRKDYRVVTVESAEEAFVCLQQDIFDAVVVDASTPGFADAPGVATQLKTHISDDRLVPIIAAQSDYGKVGSDYHAVLTKPYERDALLEKIRGAIPERVG